MRVSSIRCQPNDHRGLKSWHHERFGIKRINYHVPAYANSLSYLLGGLSLAVQKSDWENFPSNQPPAQEVDLLKKFGLELDDMALALLIWLCTLPLISTLIVPFFGWQRPG